ncbi:MAG: NADH-quinone oxidoreductase subunit NuoG [Actinomycetota bacterium]|nr:NADH-quinone oxidoreductase subunit NuoG [Actinomycetota bacterium]
MSEPSRPGGVAAPYVPPFPTQSAVGTPAPTAPRTDETVTINLDGRPVTVPKGQLIITAAEEAGVYIPRFCYHPRMKPVGMCRMCLVEVVGPRGSSLIPACYNPVGDGMDIRTQSQPTKKAQDGVLEFLLINHPLDCPVCDKGGECPLQDQTLSYGPGETRFVEEKRHWDKPIPISDLVYLDRERCIQCGRCVRFADEVAGDPLIDFAARGDETEVATFPDSPFSSYFSGNIVQICPVGALTATPYRFRARPWDLEQVESSCTSCSIGCRVAVQSSSDEVTRYIGVDSDPVNWGWLCDKGRFDYTSLRSDQRITVPLMRRGEELVEVSWAEALDAAAVGLAAARDVGARNPGSNDGVAVIGGARLPNEDAYVWAKAARTALGTDNVDAQMGDGLPATTVLGLPRATIDEAVAAPLVVTLAPDVKEELPIVYLRLRDAAREGSLPIVELAPRRGGLSRYAAQSLCYRPGEVVDLVRALAGSSPVDGPVAGVAAVDIEGARQRMADAWERGRPGAPSIVVILGRPSMAESGASIASAAHMLAGLPGVAFLSALRRSNVHGALDLGLAPGILPGRVALEEGRSYYEEAWGAELPAKPGLDTAGILASAAAGRLGGLVLVGADPVADFPDAAAAARGMQGARFVVAVDTFLTASSRHADVFLPAATYAERRGTFTNLEGRISWLGQMVTVPGMGWPDWMIATELADRLGTDLGFTSLEEIWAEVERLSPLHRGAGYDTLASRQGRDGVVVPIDPDAGHVAPRRLDPMADPGIASTENHMASPTPLSGAGAGRVDVTVASGEADGAALGGADSALAESSRPTSADTAGKRPTMITVPAAGSAATRPPPGDGLRLVATRNLWDAGTIVTRSSGLGGLAPAPTVGIRPDDLERLGIAEGTSVRITSAKGTVVAPARAEWGLAPRCVSLPWNSPLAAINTLIDAAAPYTEVGLEPAGDRDQTTTRPAEEATDHA